MNTFLKLLQPRSNLFVVPAVRTLFATPTLHLKEIQETQHGKDLHIEGVYVTSSRASQLVPLPKQDKCSLCALGLELKHTDVLIISQFLRSDGCMLPKRVTGLCKKQQKRLSYLVKMAQKAGLMPNLNPPNSKKDPTKRFAWKKYNKYFDESTISFKLRY